jgi:carboxymethylenebutenolidase
MCNEVTERENDAYLKKHPQLSRRQFNTLAAGAVAMMLPKVANAVTVSGVDVSVTTPDGEADCYFVHPAEGRHPAVLIWPDIRGLRPAFRAMGDRLAQSGYSVLVVNPFYRGARAPLEVGDDFREVVGPLRAALTPEAVASDAQAFIDYLDAQASVDTSRKAGTTGYCMGGPLVMRTAAAVPERIGAVASFHGGGLVTDTEDSPHLLIPDMNARVLIAIAENDDQRDPEAKVVLQEHFAAASLPAEIEVYEDAMHGWCPPDSRVYHEQQAERAWARLLVLLDNTLG